MDYAARVMVDVEGAVAHVRLNRPDKLTRSTPRCSKDSCPPASDSCPTPIFARSWSRQWTALSPASTSHSSLASPRGVRAPSYAADDRRRIGGAAALGPQAALVWSQVPVPVIAAIHGVAYGGGLQIALVQTSEWRPRGTLSFPSWRCGGD